MKHVKMLGLAAVAAMALMAFVGAGSASAAGGTLCSAAENPCSAANRWAVPTVLDFSVPAKGSVTLENTAGTVTLNTCTESTVKGDIEFNGDANDQATGKNTSITWGGCTHTSTTIVLGKLRVEATTGGNGEVYADEEIRVTISGLFPGENCVYGVAKGATIGTITEGIGTGSIFHANAIAEKTEPGTDICFTGPSSARWTGTYVLTEPSNTTLYVSAS